MKRVLFGAGLVVAAFFCFCFECPADGPAGATAFGWRKDGSGCYPEANPPVSWCRVAKSVRDLSARAKKPKEGEAPAPEDAIPEGDIHRWLVLGPLPVDDPQNSDKVLPDAPAMFPDEGDAAGGLSWKAVTIETSCLDFGERLRVPADRKGVAAYALTYLHAPTDRTVVLNGLSQGQGTTRVWLNGALVYNPGKNYDLDSFGAKAALALKKGWNRLLVLDARTLNNRKTWWFTCSLFGGKESEFDARGIVWTTPTPYPGASAPALAGDRLFITAESGSLLCVNKADGKILWVRTTTYYDFATDEERRASPEVFKKLDPVAEQVRRADVEDAVMPWKAPTLEKDYRWSYEGALFFKGMADVDKAKYGNPATWGIESGYTACAPLTDGKLVWALFGSGIVVCYDLDGNLRWKRLLRHKMVEHGYATSPLLVDGKLVIYFDDFTELDPATGAVVLERPHYLPKGAGNQIFGVGAVLMAGNEKVIVYPGGEFRRVSDGKTLQLDAKKLPGVRDGLWPDSWLASPVVRDGVAYRTASKTGGVQSFRLPPLDGDKADPEVLKNVPFNLDDKPYYYEPFYCASPLYHDGLLYCVNDFGWLTVVDMAKGEVLYHRLLDLDTFMPYNGGLLKGGVSSSPTLAGKYIYIWGNQGVCVVMEPGRTFKPVARNRIENFNAAWPANREATMTEPVFEGSRMYYRGQFALYCIGEK